MSTRPSPQFADTPIHQAFELGISVNAGAGLTELLHVQSTDPIFRRRNHLFERLGRDNGQPLYFDLTQYLMTPFSHERSPLFWNAQLY